MTDFSAVVATVWLASMFIYSGSAKLGEYRHSRNAAINYDLLPLGAARAVGLGLPWLELAAATMLLIRPTHRLAGGVAGVLGVAFALAAYSVLRRGLNTECGCTGGGQSLVNVTTLARAGLIAAAGTLIAITGAGRLPAAASAMIVAASLSFQIALHLRRAQERRRDGARRLSRDAEIVKLTALLASPSPGRVDTSETNMIRA